VRHTGLQTEKLVRKTNVRERHNHEANQYDATRFGSCGGRFFDYVEKDYASRFLVPGRVLHVGTATGRFVSYLSKLGFRYTGLEISDSMVETANRRIARKSTKADVIQADGENPPIRESSFDNVLCVRSYHFLPQPKLFLRNVFNVLKPAGRIIVSFELYSKLRNPAHFLRVLPEPLPKRTFYMVSDVARDLRKFGFHLIWMGKATKLPLLGYWKMPAPMVPLLRNVHSRLPHTLGTVGLVVGEKPRSDGGFHFGPPTPPDSPRASV
jgi:SAM-dependent methyltransferase